MAAPIEREPPVTRATLPVSEVRIPAGEVAAGLPETIVLDDPTAMREAALLGLGVALIAVPDVLKELESGALVRLLPHWYGDAGAISLYYANRTSLPAKTRVFVDFVAEAFRRERLAARRAEAALRAGGWSLDRDDLAAIPLEHREGR